MSKKEKYVIYKGGQVTALATRGGDVVIEIELPEFGLMPGVQAAFQISPHDARELARHLQEMALLAEKSALSEHQ